MNKILMIIVLGGLVLLTSGCDESKEISCTLERNDKINNYSLKATYNIKANNNVVSSVQTTEEVKSNDKSILQTFEEQYNSTYEAMNKAYGGYKYEIKKSNNKIISNVKINYNKLDLDTLAKDEPTMKNIMNDKNEIALTKLQKQYESMGATCKTVAYEAKTSVN